MNTYRIISIIGILVCFSVPIVISVANGNINATQDALRWCAAKHGPFQLTEDRQGTWVVQYWENGVWNDGPRLGIWVGGKRVGRLDREGATELVNRLNGDAEERRKARTALLEYLPR
jgi:hypothetical protein